MSQAYIASYLNDHLAGSEGALELLDHLERAHAETPVAQFAAELRSAIAADRQQLETLLGRLNIAPSRPRKMAAWLAEKMTELKLRIDDKAGGPFHLLEILDGLSIGIEGKRLLWLALGAACERNSSLRGLDYPHLERRAEEQRRSVEIVRLEAARQSLKSD